MGGQGSGIWEVVDDPTTSIIERLADVGLPADLIASSLQIDVRVVRQVVRHQTAEEKQLASEVRDLAKLVLQDATRIMRWGPFEQRMRIINSMMPTLGRLSLADEGESPEETRRELDELFATLRVSTDGINAAVEAASEEVDDSDEELGDS